MQPSQITEHVAAAEEPASTSTADYRRVDPGVVDPIPVSAPPTESQPYPEVAGLRSPGLRKVLGHWRPFYASTAPEHAFIDAAEAWVQDWRRALTAAEQNVTTLETLVQWMSAELAKAPRRFGAPMPIDASTIARLLATEDRILRQLYRYRDAGRYPGATQAKLIVVAGTTYRADRLPSPAVATPKAPAVVGRNECLPLGIHFGLDDESYHADPGLGSSDLRRLSVSPADFWENSKMNPDRADNSTDAKMWGRAFHKLVLEGGDAYAAAFAVEPEPDAFDGPVLMSADDLKGWLKARNDRIAAEAAEAAGEEQPKPKGRKRAEGQDALTGTKAELIGRIRKHDREVVIWDEIIERFRAETAARGATIIKPAMHREITRAAQMLVRNPHLARAFQGGAPEVSVFWEDASGVRLKARIDYFKPATWVDLKSLSNPFERPFDDVINAAVSNHRLDMQARHYLDALPAIWQAAEETRIYGDCQLPDDWHQMLAAPEDLRFTWVFLQKTGAPISRAIDVSASATAFQPAIADLARAKAAYLASLATFGDSPWLDEAPIRTLADGDLSWSLRQRIVRDDAAA